MLAANGASALGEAGDDNIRDPHAVKGDRRSNDIYDGVDGADFMEMHLFQRHVMGERLCFRYDMEHLARQCFRRVCHVCRVDDAHDLCQMASVVVMLMVMMRLFASVSMAVMRLVLFIAMATMRFLVLMAVAVMLFLFLVTVAVMCFFVLVAVAVMLFLLRGCRADRRWAIEVGHIMVMIFMGCI